MILHRGRHPGDKTSRGSQNKSPFVTAEQTSHSEWPILAYLRQQPHNEVEVAVFAASQIAPFTTCAAHGLWCFGATTVVSGGHERNVTGGSKANSSLPHFKAIST